MRRTWLHPRSSPHQHVVLSLRLRLGHRFTNVACVTNRLAADIGMSLYGRLVASCRADGEDIALQMIRNGWAMVSATASATYLAGQQEASNAGAGLWAGAFVAPRDWRQRNWQAKIFGRLTVQPQTSEAMLTSAFGSVPPSPDCAIKGNVNSSGECIFHRPGGRWYKRITMEAKHGDRWFCSPVEAIASGCRETRR
jgi:Staphylococcal nuclease homologue